MTAPRTRGAAPPLRTGSARGNYKGCFPGGSAEGQFWRLRPASVGRKVRPPPPGGLWPPGVAPPSRGARRISQSVGVCPQGRRGEGDFGEPAAGLFSLPSCLPSHLSSPPLPPLLAQPLAEPSATTRSRPSPRRPRGRSSAPGGGGSREPAPPCWGRAAAPPVRVEARRRTDLGRGGTLGVGDGIILASWRASAPGRKASGKWAKGRGVTGLAGGEEITGCGENRLGRGDIPAGGR